MEAPNPCTLGEREKPAGQGHVVSVVTQERRNWLRLRLGQNGTVVFLNESVSVQGCSTYSTRRIAGRYGVLEHLPMELGNSDTALPVKVARMPASGTEGRGGVVAQRLAVMARTW